MNNTVVDDSTASSRGAEEICIGSALAPNDVEVGPSSLPLVIKPDAADIDLVEWAHDHHTWIAKRLAECGAILFRGFAIDDQQFETFIRATSSGALPYTERSSPRSQVSGHVYTSTDYPPKQPIFLHNEQSYNCRFPTKIYFMCTLPAQVQGSTPLCDCRRIYQRLNPVIRRRFAEKKYMYVRNFGGGLGLDWQEAFQTHDRAAVESYCRSNDIHFEWLAGDQLRTRQIREPIARHPVSGAHSWFNHLTFFNASTLPVELREALLLAADEEDLPNNTYYGDGSKIEESVMDELRALYDSEKIIFAWERNDVLLIDNMLVAHGREPFVGPRRVITGLADLCEWTSVTVPTSVVPHN